MQVSWTKHREGYYWTRINGARILSQVLPDPDRYGRLLLKYSAGRIVAVSIYDNWLRKPVPLSYLVIGPPPEAHLETDHRNRDTTDNRRCNLHFVTKSENCLNRLTNTAYYRWVSRRQRKPTHSVKYEIQIKSNRKRYWIGHWKDGLLAITISDFIFELLKDGKHPAYIKQLVDLNYKGKR